MICARPTLLTLAWVSGQVLMSHPAFPIKSLLNLLSTCGSICARGITSSSFFFHLIATVSLFTRQTNLSSSPVDSFGYGFGLTSALGFPLERNAIKQWVKVNKKQSNKDKTTSGLV